jgi:hypothetical protein
VSLPHNANLRRDTELVQAPGSEDGTAHALARLVTLMLVAEGPSRIRLADNAALHATFVQAECEGPLAVYLPTLGHRPDPMVGRRISGLDRALQLLATDGTLVPTGGTRWRVSYAAAIVARRELADFPSAARDAIRALSRHWRRLLRAEAERRGTPLAVEGAA